MRTCKKIQVKIVGNDDANPEEVRKIWGEFFDKVLTKKSISEIRKKSPENKKVGLEESIKS